MSTFTSKATNPEVPEVTDVSTEEVHEKRQDLTFIDVRQDDEFVGELGHIQGAQLITLDTLESRLNEIPKGKPVIFICRSGKRSITASKIALDAGFDDVYNMVGGMIAWNDLGYDVER